MLEGMEPERREEQSGGEDSGVAEDSPHGGVGGQEGEGSGAAEATPEIGEEGEVGQTQAPSPEDDVGSPEDDESGTEE
jgi:hypothetical protein